MLVITGYDQDGNAVRLTVNRNPNTSGAILRLYEPPGQREEFENDLEGRLIGGIILDAADALALQKNL